MVTVCTIFYFLGAFHMSYMHMGPGKDTVFMGLRIDNWVKWSALATFSFMNTCINEFISNSLNPWFLNSLQVSTDTNLAAADPHTRLVLQARRHEKCTPMPHENACGWARFPCATCFHVHPFAGFRRITRPGRSNTPTQPVSGSSKSTACTCMLWGFSRCFSSSARWTLQSSGYLQTG